MNYFPLQINFGPVYNPGKEDTTVVLEVAFNTKTDLAAGDNTVTIKVGAADSGAPAFKSIANVSVMNV